MISGATAVAASDGRALGTSVRVVVTDPGRLSAARAAVDRVVADIDLACSRFRDDSELVRVQARGGHPVRLSPLLCRAIAAALRAARLTDGLVDPTVGTAVRTLGYAVDFAAVERDGGALQLLAASVPGWQALDFDEARAVLAVPAGVEVDLGATAKALAADLAAEAAAAAAECGVLVSLGGDIAVAGAAPPDGWVVLVAEDSEAPLVAGGETVSVRDGGLATSSTTIRRWRRGGIEMHHLVDPRTSLPAAGRWRSVTVAAGDCLDANTAATAAIVLGDDAADWLSARGLPARLVDTTGAVTRVGGWPAPA